VLINQRARIESTLFATLIWLLLAVVVRQFFYTFSNFCCNGCTWLPSTCTTTAKIQGIHAPEGTKYATTPQNSAGNRKSQDQAHHTSALKCVSIETEDRIGLAGEASSGLTWKLYAKLSLGVFLAGSGNAARAA